MPVDLGERQALATKFGTDALYAFLATGDPGTGTSVANEVSGGSPAYVRVGPLTWTSPDANGQIQAVATFNVPATTINYGGLATSASGASKIASGQVTQKVYPQQAIHTLTITLRVNST